MQITINENDSFSIVSNGSVSGYDGHSLRASSYFANDMPDITEKISFAETGNKFYKVTLDDGSIEYLSDSDPRYKELINDD